MAFMQLAVTGMLLLFFLFLEILDWQGRMELIELRWPTIWKALNNRPARLVLLFLCFAFLIRDFKDAVAIAQPPTIAIKAPSVPDIIYQITNEPLKPPPPSQIIVEREKRGPPQPNRAYITFSKLAWLSKANVYVANEPVAMQVTFKTSGTIPPKNHRIYRKIIQGEAGREAEELRWQAWLRDIAASPVVNRGSIGIGETFSTTTTAIRLSQNERRLVKSGEQPLYVMVRIVFDDDAGEQNAEVCLLLTGENADALKFCVAGHNT